ncbi:MAG TPA: hypothetical protein VE172_18750 [Stackebrandtia sp.]|nr:hypothetical protein [Stackebrandtia sp.]HZE40844.1 hypothetical protein [Stackebrandtia sp.]
MRRNVDASERACSQITAATRSSSSDVASCAGIEQLMASVAGMR